MGAKSRFGREIMSLLPGMVRPEGRSQTPDRPGNRSRMPDRGPRTRGPGGDVFWHPERCCLARTTSEYAGRSEGVR
jgi:hypothetical protein